jgi:hypothetical protein
MLRDLLRRVYARVVPPPLVQVDAQWYEGRWNEDSADDLENDVTLRLTDGRVGIVTKAEWRRYQLFRNAIVGPNHPLNERFK